LFEFHHSIGLFTKGLLSVGKRADLILFNLNEGKLSIKKIMVGGKMVYEKLINFSFKSEK